MPYYEAKGKSLSSRIGAADVNEKLQAALAELRKRGVKNDYCSRCETHDWNVDLLEIPANSALSAAGLPAFRGSAFQRGPSGYLSLLAAVCKNCGNTIFHNLGILGFPLG